MIYVGWDLEIARDIKDVSELRDTSNLGVSVAAAYWGADAFKEWHSNAPKWLTQDDNAEMLQWLIDYHPGSPSKVVTWNGLRFDIPVLGHSAGDMESAQKLALDHVDMMFFIFMRRGYAASLENCGKAMQVGQKTEGMSGALAPSMWASGTKEDADKCKEYVLGDAKLTHDIAQKALETGVLRWFARSGKLHFEALPRDKEGNPYWPTVEECLSWEQPDNSWMNDPWKKEDFIEWMS